MKQYMTFHTEFAVRRFFSTEDNRVLLESFLNSILPGSGTIKRSEYLGDRKPLHLMAESNVHDYLCEDDAGKTVLVELQKAEHDIYSNPECFFCTFPALEQAPDKCSGIRLHKVCIIGMLDFTFDDNDSPEYLHCDEKMIGGFGDDPDSIEMTRIYVEAPKFTKSEFQLDTMLDKWLYIYRNLEMIETIPEALQDPVFERLFELADTRLFSDDEEYTYRSSLRNLWDWESCLESAYKKGLFKGRMERAQKLLATGEVSVREAASLTGLSVSDIEKYAEFPAKED